MPWTQRKHADGRGLWNPRGWLSIYAHPKRRRSSHQNRGIHTKHLIEASKQARNQHSRLKHPVRLPYKAPSHSEA